MRHRTSLILVACLLGSSGCVRDLEVEDRLQAGSVGGSADTGPALAGGNGPAASGGSNAAGSGGQGATIQPSVTAGALLGRHFTLRDAVNFTAVQGTQPQLDFHDESGFTIRAGCNAIRGEFAITDSRLVVPDAMSQTLIGCAQALATQDRWLMEFFQGDPSVTLQGHELTFSSGTTTLTFSDAASTTPPSEGVGGAPGSGGVGNTSNGTGGGGNTSYGAGGSVGCLALGAISVSVQVKDLSGQPVSDAVVDYSVDGSEPSRCDSFSSAVYACGVEEAGVFTITATRGASTATGSVVVEQGECHVQQQTLSLVLGG